MVSDLDLISPVEEVEIRSNFKVSPCKRETNETRSETLLGKDSFICMRNIS